MKTVERNLTREGACELSRELARQRRDSVICSFQTDGHLYRVMVYPDTPYNRWKADQKVARLSDRHEDEGDGNE